MHQHHRRILLPDVRDFNVLFEEVGICRDERVSFTENHRMKTVGLRKGHRICLIYSVGRSGNVMHSVRPSEEVIQAMDEYYGYTKVTFTIVKDHWICRDTTLALVIANPYRYPGEAFVALIEESTIPLENLKAMVAPKTAYELGVEAAEFVLEEGGWIGNPFYKDKQWCNHVTWEKGYNDTKLSLE